MEVDPRRLRVFLAVVRAGGVIGASRVMHTTPQAVSQQIGTLEDELGVPLFDRSRRRLVPTAVGITLATHAERVEAELIAAGRAIAAATGRASGVVRIAAFQSVIRWLVVQAIPVVRTEHPGVVPTVIELDGKGVGQALRTGEVDLVLDEQDDEQPAPNLRGSTMHLVLRDPYQLVVPSSLARVLDDPGAWASQRWIAAPDGTASHAALVRLARRGRFEPDVAHVCKEFPSVLALVAAGEGIAIVPELALCDARTVESRPIARLGARNLVAIQRISRRGTEPAVDAVVSALRRRPRGGP